MVCKQSLLRQQSKRTRPVGPPHEVAQEQSDCHFGARLARYHSQAVLASMVHVQKSAMICSVEHAYDIDELEADPILSTKELGLLRTDPLELL
eukprot:2826194-Amphidinium_carterae.1